MEGHLSQRFRFKEQLKELMSLSSRKELEEKQFLEDVVQHRRIKEEQVQDEEQIRMHRSIQQSLNDEMELSARKPLYCKPAPQLLVLLPPIQPEQRPTPHQVFMSFNELQN